MTQVPVSVIVVSRARPQALCRCLMAVSQLVYHPFEVVVVADQSGLAAAERLSFSDRIRFRRCDEANISAARNIGLAASAGDLVAFVDDDAVPEPGWLFHLTAPFADRSVAAAGGFVRGANGISYQWQGQWIDEFGYSHDIPLHSHEPHVLAGAPGHAIKTQGTNCAFRRKVLADMGGFDPAYRYYLDETDLDMRLAAVAAKTALVPLAEVHHATAASGMRESSRMPKTLHEIGASQMVFLRKYAPANRIDEVVADFQRAHRQALVRHMIAGHCEPRDIDRVLQTLFNGLNEGRGRALVTLPRIPGSVHQFRSLHREPAKQRNLVMSGYRLHARRLRQQARKAAQNGATVTLVLLSRSTRFHRIVYRDGYWEQAGGLFGKSDRQDPLFRLTTMKARVAREMGRVAKNRDIKDRG